MVLSSIVKTRYNEFAWTGRAAVFNALDGSRGRPKTLAYIIWPCFWALR